MVNNFRYIKDVGPGWRPIVIALAIFCDMHNINIVQVKEKYGALRLYAWAEDNLGKNLKRRITRAEALSEKTCEWCGAPAQKRSNGWVKTLCDTHAEAWRGGKRWWLDAEGKRIPHA